MPACQSSRIFIDQHPPVIVFAQAKAENEATEQRMKLEAERKQELIQRWAGRGGVRGGGGFHSTAGLVLLARTTCLLCSYKPPALAACNPTRDTLLGRGQSS